MKVCITGGLGFIGTNVAKKFLSEGWEVLAFDNLERNGVEHNLADMEDQMGYTHLRGDVTDREDVAAIGQVDAIVHLAANPGIPRSIEDPRYDFEVNALGTLNILEHARSIGNRPVVYASTNKVYSDVVNDFAMYYQNSHGTRLYVLSDPYHDGIPVSFPVDGRGKNPHSPYGCSKYVGDTYCQEYFHQYGLPTTVFRMSCIYGEHQIGVQDQGWTAWFMVAKLLGKPLTIFGDGHQVRDVLFGEDVAELYYKAVVENDKFAGKVFNVGGGNNNAVSLRQAISIIDEIGGGEPLQMTFEDWRPADHRVYVSDIGNLSELWRPKTSVKEGFKRTFDWIKENITKRDYGY